MAYAETPSNIHSTAAEYSHWAVRFLFLLFVLVCIFDPADEILGGKVEVFLALWVASLLSLPSRWHDASLPAWLLVYVIAFNALPLLSIIWYQVSNGQQPFGGFQLLKGHLFVSLALILVLNRIDLIPRLSAVLTVLAVLAIGIFVALEINPGLFNTLYNWGNNTGLLVLHYRAYGNNLTLLQVDFVTSAMIVVAIAYYFDRAMSVPRGWNRLGCWSLVAVNIAGMLLAGTRNNILVSILLPFCLWPIYARRVAFTAFCSMLVLTLLALPFANQLQTFFNGEEFGNNLRLGLIPDYIYLFGDPVTLLFGQGLGAYHFWNARGYSDYVTDLTYLEIIRNFGLVGAAVLMAMLLFPVVHAFVYSAARQERALAMAYFFYLVMSITNPLLFSSNGMLILAILIANIALYQGSDQRIRNRL